MYITTSVFGDHGDLQSELTNYYCSHCGAEVKSNLELKHYVNYVPVINPDRYSTLDMNVAVGEETGKCCETCLNKKMKNYGKISI